MIVEIGLTILVSAIMGYYAKNLVQSKMDEINSRDNS